jgi:AcrR family transcriptional regulator
MPIDAVAMIAPSTHRDAHPVSETATRLRILISATELFAAQGPRATTIRALAQHANVNIAAINYHFRSKDELYGEVVERAIAHWGAEASLAGSELESADLDGFLRRLLAALLTPVFEQDSHRHMVRLLAWSLLESPSAGTTHHVHAVAKIVAYQLQLRMPSLDQRFDPSFVAQWLIGQCLLIAPVLGNDPDQQRDAREVLDLAHRLALGGLSSLDRQKQTD